MHYAGWTDKLAAVFGSANPVSGPYFSFSAPEPTGVVGVLAPAADSLLGLVSVIAPDHRRRQRLRRDRRRSTTRCLAVTLAEVLATSDLPGGVINMLTGRAAELAPHLAAHGDVNALDLTGADAELRAEPRAGRGRDGQAGLRADGRARLRSRAGDRTAAGVPGDQDGLAPDRRALTVRRHLVLRREVRRRLR